MPVISFAIGTSIIFATGVTSGAAVTGILAATSALLANAPRSLTLPASQYLYRSRKHG